MISRDSIKESHLSLLASVNVFSSVPLFLLFGAYKTNFSWFSCVLAPAIKNGFWIDSLTSTSRDHTLRWCQLRVHFFFLVQCTFLEDSCSSRCLLTLKAEILLSILHRLQEGFSAFGEMWRKIRQVSHWKITSFFPNLGKTNPNLKGISFLFFKVRSRLKRGLKTTKSVMSSL